MNRRSRWLVSGAVAALVASTLTVSPSLGDEPVHAVDDVISDVPIEQQVAEPTISEVPLTEVEAPVTYADSLSVPESTGDEQQSELLESETTEDTTEVAGAARVDLNSDIAVIGVTWDLNSAEPKRIESRHLTAGEWSAWAELEIAPVHESVDPADVTQGSTEGIFVTDVEAVEVIAYTADGESHANFTVNVIDPRGEENVSNDLELEGDAEQQPAEPAEPQSQNAEENPGARENTEPNASDSVDSDTTSETDSSDDAVVTETPQSQISATAHTSTGSNVETAVDRTGRMIETASVIKDPFIGLTINSRKAWGANEKIRKPNTHRDPVYKGAVVHHTAGTNTYTKAQVPGIIRGIYTYHTVTQGWGDIGYQLLVDKYGGVWEGRYESIRKPKAGAQAYGANFETFGVSVLGNFQSATPTRDARKSTAKAIAWMFDSFGVEKATGNIRVPGGNYKGRSVPVISGHYQIGSGTAWATACPGKNFIPLLPDLRKQVAGYMLAPLTGALTRINGTDRFDTAAKAATSTFTTANTVYIANGMDYPDALAGGVAAGSAGVPILLTTRTGVPAQTVEALKKLKTKHVVILGGTGVVSASVANRLKSVTKGTVTRYGGADRYATAANVAKKTASKADVVYVASGKDFPDALTGVPIAGAEKAALLLTERNSLPSATTKTLRQINPDRIVVLGGTGVVSARIATSLKSVAPTTRHHGADRFATAADLVTKKFPGRVDTVYLSTGMDFPDALAGGPVGAKNRSPILLTLPNSVPPATAKALEKLKPKKIVILGGVGPVSRLNEYRLNEYIVP